MNKKELKKLAIMGITGGLLLGSQCPLKAEMDLAAGYNWYGQQQQQNQNNMNRNGNNANMNRNGNMNHNANQNSQGGSACGGAGGCGHTNNNNNNNNNNKNKNNANMNRGKEVSMSGGDLHQEKHMTEEEMLSQLNPQMKAVYQNMSPEGKELALKLAAEMQDKNAAVRTAAEKMLEKRRNLHNNNNNKN